MAQMVEFVCSYLVSLNIGNGQNIDVTGLQSLVLGCLTRSKSTFTSVVLGLYYVNLYSKATQNTKLTANGRIVSLDTFSLYTLFTLGLVCASKYLEDNTFTNKAWSEISKIPLNQINTLEMGFLTILQFNVHINEQRYSQWLNYLLDFVAKSPKQTSTIPYHQEQEQEQQHQQQPQEQLKKFRKTHQSHQDSTIFPKTLVSNLATQPQQKQPQEPQQQQTRPLKRSRDSENNDSFVSSNILLPSHSYRINSSIPAYIEEKSCTCHNCTKNQKQ